MTSLREANKLAKKTIRVSGNKLVGENFGMPVIFGESSIVEIGRKIGFEKEMLEEPPFPAYCMISVKSRFPGTGHAISRF